MPVGGTGDGHGKCMGCRLAQRSFVKSALDKLARRGILWLDWNRPLMDKQIFASLALIVFLGFLAQWVSWRLRLPAILLLLIAGFLVGPVVEFARGAPLLDPDGLFGDLLFPVVQAAVAIILFEGGLSLKLSDLRKAGFAILRLISIGVVVTWALATFLGVTLLGFEVAIALLLGALLTVTGPTVILPMLRTIRPRGSVKHIAKWEGILNDPAGVVLAVLVFEAHLAGGLAGTPLHILEGIGKTLLIGIAFTALGAGVIILVIRAKAIPEYLHNFFVLTVVLTMFEFSNLLQEESGLLTVTLLGIVIANQQVFDIRHITEFKEQLQLLLISGLFIVLAARVDAEAFQYVGWESFAFLAALILVVRPLSVLLSTIGSQTNWRERVLLMMLAPRGIVAVALTSIFAIRLGETDPMVGQRILAEMLVVIVGTVVFYGPLAGPVAAMLRLSNLSPQGVLFVGAHSWARRIAGELKKLEIPVLMVDSNRHNITQAHDEGLPAEEGNVFSEEFLEHLDIAEIGHAVALTANDEVNAFARGALGDFIEPAEIYHLMPAAGEGNPYGESARKMNPLFSEKATFDNLAQRFRSGGKLKTVTLRENFGMAEFQEIHGRKGLPLFAVEEDGRLRVFSPRSKLEPRVGAAVLFLHGGPGGQAAKTGTQEPGTQEPGTPKPADGTSP